MYTHTDAVDFGLLVICFAVSALVMNVLSCDFPMKSRLEFSVG